LFAYIVEDATAARLNKALFEIAWKRAGLEDQEIMQQKKIQKKFKSIN
jgi:hypothetical protein